MIPVEVQVRTLHVSVSGRQWGAFKAIATERRTTLGVITAALIEAFVEQHKENHSDDGPTRTVI